MPWTDPCGGTVLIRNMATMLAKTLRTARDVLSWTFSRDPHLPTITLAVTRYRNKRFMTGRESRSSP